MHNIYGLIVIVEFEKSFGTIEWGFNRQTLTPISISDLLFNGLVIRKSKFNKTELFQIIL